MWPKSGLPVVAMPRDGSGRHHKGMGNMMAALLGPSGSDRRFFTLVALTLLLAPLGVLVVRQVWPGAMMRDVLLIGSLSPAVLVWATVICYGVGRMAVEGLAGQEQPIDTDGAQEPLAA